MTEWFIPVKQVWFNFGSQCNSSYEQNKKEKSYHISINTKKSVWQTLTFIPKKLSANKTEWNFLNLTEYLWKTSS